MPFYRTMTSSKRFLHISALLFFCLGNVPEKNLLAAEISVDNTQTIRPKTTSSLRDFCQTLDYDWMEFNDGIPPFILKSIPLDINRSVNSKIKKKTFFMGLLPMVLLANQEIEEERLTIMQLHKKVQTGNIDRADLEQLEAITKRYGLRGDPFIDHDAHMQLLQRVDIIPPSLVLAQAANESGWGTSRFAQMGNNLFGEWTYKEGTGIVPDDRPAGETYEVRKFTSIYESLRSYMNNLNRNQAYEKLRNIRAALRKSNQAVTGTALAKGLQLYSQRGGAYVREIQAMIRQNKLGETNSVTLRNPELIEVNPFDSPGSGLLSTRAKLIGRLASPEPPPL